MGFMDSIRNKVELYRLEQRYTKREKRTTFISGAQYVDGEYIYVGSPTSSKSSSSFGNGWSPAKGPSVRVKEVWRQSKVPRPSFTRPLHLELLPSTILKTLLVHSSAASMQHHSIARSSCHAVNAFNASNALSSIFFVRSTRHAHPKSSTTTPTTSSLPHQQHLRFSTVGVRPKNHDAAKKTASGGSLANYEALMGKYTGAQPSPVKRASTDESSAVPDPTPVQVRRAGPVEERVPEGRGKLDIFRPKLAYSKRTPTPDPEPAPEKSTNAESPPQSARIRKYKGNDYHQQLKKAIETRYDESPPSTRAQTPWQKRMVRIAHTAHRCSRSSTVDPAELSIMNYNPRYIARLEQDVKVQSRPPWAVEASSRLGMTSPDYLDREIEGFARYISFSDAELAAREAVKEEVFAVIRECGDEQIETDVHGSEVTGLAMPGSDIDIRVTLKDAEDATLLHRRTFMRPLHQSFLKSAAFSHVEFRAAAFPILTLVHEATGIPVQVVSAPSSEPQQRVTAQYLSELPHLRSVYAVLKATFATRGLIDVYTGGIGAYGLFVMLVAILKRPSNLPATTPGEQLTRFLTFYSNLDTHLNGLAVHPSRPFRKHTTYPSADQKSLIDTARRRNDPVKAGQWAMGHTRKFQPYLLCLQDPANPINDLGRKTNAIKHIQATLQTLHEGLQVDSSIIERARERGEEWKRTSILDRCLGRYHEVMFEGREKVERYGMKVLMARMSGRDGGGVDGRERSVQDGADEGAAKEEVLDEAAMTATPAPVAASA